MVAGLTSAAAAPWRGSQLPPAVSLLRCHACRKCLLSAPADSEAGPRQGRLLGATPADRRQAGAAPACGWALVQHPEQQCWLGCLSVVPRRSLRQRDVSLCCRGTQARPFASHAPAPPRSGRRHRPRPPLYHLHAGLLRSPAIQVDSLFSYRVKACLRSTTIASDCVPLPCLSSVRHSSFHRVCRYCTSRPFIAAAAVASMVVC